VWDSGVPSYEFIQHEVLLTKKSLALVLHKEQPSYLLLCQGTLTCTSSHSSPKDLPPSIINLLKEFDVIFLKDGPIGPSSIMGIEQQIDFVPGASISNKLAYGTNPQETKEIETQVQDLLDNGWVQKRLSPSVVNSILQSRL